MLVVPDRKALVLALKNPEPVKACIPTAKQFEMHGRSFVAVPHRLDETRVLRNLGMPAPSPILYHYEWPGMFQPFHAQRETSAFATLYERLYILNDIGCVDSETEYLSPTGWKKISQYDGGAVAQYWPVLGNITWVDNPEYVKLPCDAMVRIKTKYGIDQLLSPEHRVLLHARSNPAKQEVVRAADLLGRQESYLKGRRGKRARRSQIGFTESCIPTTFIDNARGGMDLTDAKLRLMIAVIADGHFPNDTNRCIIRVKKQRKKDRLAALLRAAGVEFDALDEPWDGCAGFTRYTFIAPQHDKVFDEKYWACDAHQRWVVTDEVMHWDGCVREDKPTRQFTTYEERSADFVQYAFASQGFVAHKAAKPRNPGVEYTVTVRNNGRPLQIHGAGVEGARRNITVAPSTDGYKYCFMVPSTFLLLRRNGCIFATGNTGKTLASLWAADYLMRLGKIRKVLVVAPLSTVDMAWGDEIHLHFPERNYVVVHGDKRRRLKLLQQDVDFYIINHDGVEIVLNELLAMPELDLVIVDELSQVARNAGTRRWKSLNKLINTEGKHKAAWGLTGTPRPKSALDVWAQVRLLTKDRAPAFRNRWREMTMRQVTNFKWVEKPEALQLCFDAMQPAIRFTRDECVDLPEMMFVPRAVELSPEQNKLYKQMFDKLRAEAEGGEILAVNQAVKLGKLIQIACGVAIGVSGEEVSIGAPGRMAVLQEIIEEAEGKTIVFVPYIPALHYVAETLRAAGYGVGIVYGEVSKTKRNEVFTAFRNDPDMHVLVAQPAAMSHGLTLVTANTVVWYAPITSNDIFTQANGRITRPGQKLSQYIVMLSATSVERRVYKSLQEQGDMQSILLNEIQSSRDTLFTG